MFAPLGRMMLSICAYLAIQDTAPQVVVQVTKVLVMYVLKDTTLAMVMPVVLTQVALCVSLVILR